MLAIGLFHDISCSAESCYSIYWTSGVTVLLHIRKGKARTSEGFLHTTPSLFNTTLAICLQLCQSGWLIGELSTVSIVNGELNDLRTPLLLIEYSVSRLFEVHVDT